MNKKSIITAFVVTILFSIIILFVFIFRGNTILPKSTAIDLANIEGQMEYVNISSDESSTFLTYRETALASINNLGQYKITSSQFIYGAIYDLIWSNNPRYAVIAFDNDPEELSNYNDYLEEKYLENKLVYGVLDIEKALVKLLPPGVEKAWKSTEATYGYDGKSILYLEENNWKKMNLKTDNISPIISSTGECFAVRVDDKLNVYRNKQLESSQKLESRDYSRFRLLDNGQLVYVDKNKIEIFQNNKNTLLKSISESDEVIVGQNAVWYKSGNKNYLYKKDFNEFKKIDLGQFNDFETLKSFGLNDRGFFYITDEENYKLTLFRF